MGNKDKQQITPFLPPFLDTTSLLHSSLPLSPHHKWCRGMGGCSQYIIAPLSPSFLLTLFLCSSVGPLHRLQVPVKKIALVWALHRLRFLQEHPSAAAWGCPRTAVTICASAGPSRAAGYLCSGTWSTSFSLSSFSDLGVPSVVSHSFFVPSSSLWHFLSFLTHIFADAPQTLLVDSALACDGCGWNWL